MAVFVPNWPQPQSVKSLCTTRMGGASQSPWGEFNLATHVNDNLVDVKQNRANLLQLGSLPAAPQWLNQTHSTTAVSLDKSANRDADAAITKTANQVAVVLTADCLPLLISNKQGTEVAAIHAGWKGLLDGIVIKTIAAMQSKPIDLMVWLGPAISQAHFEVGSEVKQQFCDAYPQAEQHFKALSAEKYLADLYALVKDQLNHLGVADIYGGDFCSYAEQDKFYSYRRDGVTGRMASLIWLVD